MLSFNMLSCLQKIHTSPSGSMAFFLSYFGVSVGILWWTGRNPSLRRLIALALTSGVSATFEVSCLNAIVPLTVFG